MKNLKSILILGLLIEFISGCSNYINKIHEGINKDLGIVQKERNYNKFDFLTNSNKKRNTKYNSSTQISNKDVPAMAPPIKRNYNSKRGRLKASDMVDQSNEGSLWSNHGQDNFLFSPNKVKKVGDIVSIEVQGKLKQEITLELFRTFSLPKKMKDSLASKDKSKDKEKGPEKKPGEEGDGSIASKIDEENKKLGNLSEDKIYDHISGLIVEEINKDHIMVEGRKELLYQNRKRVLQVKGLIARKDVNDEDKVFSSAMLESTVSFIR